MLRLTRIFPFEMAHNLPSHDGLCKGLHGHSYELEVTVKGHKVRLYPWTPTMENLLEEGVKQLQAVLPPGVELVRMKLKETSKSYAEWLLEDQKNKIPEKNEHLTDSKV